MTTRELYVSIINGEITDEVIAKASELLAKHDASNEKRKSSESKEKREARERLALVRESLTEIPQFADSIAEVLGITVGQARSALSTLVREGVATKAEVKVDKSRKMAYTIAIGE